MNTRAVSDTLFLTLIFAVIVGILIAFTFTTLGRLLFAGGGELRTAQVNLQSLDQVVLTLIAMPEQFVPVRNYPLFVQENAFIIAGFAAEDEVGWSWCDGLWGGERISRPDACPQNKACLCLYEDGQGSDFDSDIAAGSPAPKSCQILPNNVVFLAPENRVDAPGGDAAHAWNWGGSAEYASTSVQRVNNAGGGPMQRFLPEPYSYENLVVYGECGSMAWNKQNAYIEKFAGDGNVYIYLAKESDKTQKRFEALRRAFPAVPAQPAEARPPV